MRTAVSISSGASAVSNRPLKKSAALTVRCPRRAGNVDLAIERHQAGWKLGGRVGERDRAADGAAVADCGMADMRHGRGDQRRMTRDLGRALGLGMANQRPDLDPAVLHHNVVEPVDAVDVDQQGGMAEPHIERCHQALPAGEHPCILSPPAGRARARPSEPWHSQVVPASSLPPSAPAVLVLLSTLLSRPSILAARPRRLASAGGSVVLLMTAAGRRCGARCRSPGASASARPRACEMRHAM